MSIKTISGVQIIAPVPAEFADFLSIPAQEFLVKLQRYHLFRVAGQYDD